MHGIETAIIDMLRSWFDTMGWWATFLAMVIESACIPLPSEIIMPLTGWLMVADRHLGWPGVFQAALWGGLGNLVGSVLTYWVGARVGRPIVEKWGKWILLSPHDLDIAERWFARYGEWATFIGRILPIVRTFISFPAGAAHMNFARFSIFTFVGSFLWCIPLAWAGMHWGPQWEEFRNKARIADYPIAAIIVALAVFFIWHRLKTIREHEARNSRTDSR